MFCMGRGLQHALVHCRGGAAVRSGVRQGSGGCSTPWCTGGVRYEGLQNVRVHGSGRGAACNGRHGAITACGLGLLARLVRGLTPDGHVSVAGQSASRMLSQRSVLSQRSRCRAQTVRARVRALLRSVAIVVELSDAVSHLNDSSTTIRAEGARAAMGGRPCSTAYGRQALIGDTSSNEACPADHSGGPDV